MSFSKPARVSLVGLGALGILYASHLAAHKEVCTLSCVVNEERKKRYGEEGVFLRDTRLALDYVTPDEEPAAPADLLMVAVKGTTLDSAVRDVKKHVGKGTVIISLLNGITSEEKLKEAYPEATVLYCIAQGMDAMRVKQVLAYHKEGELVIGTDNPAHQQAVDDVVELLRSAEIVCREDKDILHRLHAKWMMNVGFNQVITYFEGMNETVQKPGEARDMLIAAMREARAIANAKGIELTDKDLEEYVALGDSLAPTSMPSMRQDALAGRPTEVELFAGVVLSLGKKFGIETPVNAKLYEVLKKLG